jgi:hypothetical protein
MQQVINLQGRFKGATCVLYRRINILKLANYFSLEALPASRLDAGDVYKLE